MWGRIKKSNVQEKKLIQCACITTVNITTNLRDISWNLIHSHNISLKHIKLDFPNFSRRIRRTWRAVYTNRLHLAGPVESPSDEESTLSNRFQLDSSSWEGFRGFHFPPDSSRALIWDQISILLFQLLSVSSMLWFQVCFSFKCELWLQHISLSLCVCVCVCVCRYKLSTRPVYRQRQQISTALLWRCCPGHGGHNCEDAGGSAQASLCCHLWRKKKFSGQMWCRNIHSLIGERPESAFTP